MKCIWIRRLSILLWSIIIRFLEGGQLLDRISILKRPYNEDETKVIMKHILYALSYMHKMGYAHRDIKLENIMYENKDNYSCKIIDFGFTTKFAPGTGFNEILGSPLYMSPQVILGQSYTYKCDIWSTGIILYFLWFGKFPYKSRGLEELKVEISNAHFTIASLNDLKGISEIGKSFLLRLLSYYEKDRPTATSLLEDPWIISEVVSPRLNDNDQNEIYSNMMQMKAY